MKNKILTFIIGALVGAIISTIGFYCYAKSLNLERSKMPEMPNGQMPQTMQQENGGNRPEKPIGGQGGMEQGNSMEMQINQESNI